MRESTKKTRKSDECALNIKKTRGHIIYKFRWLPFVFAVHANCLLDA